MIFNNRDSIMKNQGIIGVVGDNSRTTVLNRRNMSISKNKMSVPSSGEMRLINGVQPSYDFLLKVWQEIGYCININHFLKEPVKSSSSSAVKKGHSLNNASASGSGVAIAGSFVSMGKTSDSMGSASGDRGMTLQEVDEKISARKAAQKAQKSNKKKPERMRHSPTKIEDVEEQDFSSEQEDNGKEEEVESEQEEIEESEQESEANSQEEADESEEVESEQEEQEEIEESDESANSQEEIEESEANESEQESEANESEQESEANESEQESEANSQEEADESEEVDSQEQESEGDESEQQEEESEQEQSKNYVSPTFYETVSGIEIDSRGWQKFFAYITKKKPECIKALSEKMETDAKNGIDIYPSPEEIFTALELTPLEETRVLIIGQDPYHTPDTAMGVAFSVKEGQKIPPSLRNIFKELKNDGYSHIQGNGDLSDWAVQGVLMLNTAFTVQSGKAGSYSKEWKTFTKYLMNYINKQVDHLVIVLWGKHAQSYRGYFDEDRHSFIESVHPSPLSASSGFFGSKPFSKVNKYLRKLGQDKIDWNLE